MKANRMDETIRIGERIPGILMYILQISMEIQEDKGASLIRWPNRTQTAWKNALFQPLERAA